MKTRITELTIIDIEFLPNARFSKLVGNIVKNMREIDFFSSNSLCFYFEISKFSKVYKMRASASFHPFTTFICMYMYLKERKVRIHNNSFDVYVLPLLSGSASGLSYIYIYTRSKIIISDFLLLYAAQSFRIIDGERSIFPFSENNEKVERRIKFYFQFQFKEWRTKEFYFSQILCRIYRR